MRPEEVRQSQQPLCLFRAGRSIQVLLTGSPGWSVPPSFRPAVTCPSFWIVLEPMALVPDEVVAAVVVVVDGLAPSVPLASFSIPSHPTALPMVSSSFDPVPEEGCWAWYSLSSETASCLVCSPDCCMLSLPSREPTAEETAP